MFKVPGFLWHLFFGMGPKKIPFIFRREFERIYSKNLPKNALSNGSFLGINV